MSYASPGRLALLIAFLALPVVVFAGLRERTVSDGTFTGTLSWSGSAATVDDVVGKPSGLLGGERVTGVDGQSLEYWAAHLGHAPRRRIGDRLRYDVLHPDGRTETMSVTLRRYPLPGGILGWSLLTLTLSIDALAVVAIRHRPHDPSAQLVLAGGFVMPLTAFQWPTGLGVIDLAGGQGLWLFVVGEVATALAWGVLLHFAVVFPHRTRLVGRNGRIVAGAYLTPFALFAASWAYAQTHARTGLAQLSAALSITWLASQVCPLMVIVVMAANFRRLSTADERRPIVWVLAGFSTSLVLFAALLLAQSLLGHDLAPSGVKQLVLVLLPASIGAGILRYRLFDVEVIVKRSLLYAGMTAATLSAYVVATWGLNRVLGRSIVMLVGSGVVALVVVPLGDRWQRAVTRLIYGDRNDPYEMISRLGRLDTATGPTQVLQTLVETVAETLRLPFVAIEVDLADGTFKAAAGQVDVASERPRVLALVHGAEQVGRMLLAVGARREPFGPADSRLLDDLARTVGSIVYALSVALALQRIREQLVTAREEERRRIRRDLHDRLGSDLVARAMQFEAAQGLIDTEPGKAEDLLGSLLTATHESIIDIRQLLEKLRPPALDELGLVAALRERSMFIGRQHRCAESGQPLEVIVHAEGEMLNLPAAVEVAAYHIATAAVARAASGGTSNRCTIGLHGGNTLLIEIRTDAPDSASETEALRAIREQAEEVGGSLNLTASVTGDTVISARLPLPEHDRRA